MNNYIKHSAVEHFDKARGAFYDGMSMTPHRSLIPALLVLLLVGCATVEDPSPEPEPAPEEAAPAPSAPEETASQPEETANAEPAAEEGPESAAEDPGEFAVSEEVFEETFDAIDAVIADLNEIISDQDVDGWLRYLSSRDRRVLSDPEALQELSRLPALANNNITLQGIDDFFQFVVVPSRQNVRLDDIVFLDADTIDALMTVRGQSVVVYRLRREDGSWRISLAELLLPNTGPEEGR